MSIEYTTQAEWDILETVDSILTDHGVGMARAFRHRLESTLVGLEALPYSGSLVDPPYPTYPGMRVKPVTRFKARLVFYQPTPTGILVVRVLFSARDLNAIFG